MTTRDDQVHDLAKEVAKQFARDNSRKQKMLQRSPHLARAMDAEEIAGMSSRELAERELSELGIKPDGRSVEEQLLDAHHAGRDWARGIKGGEAAAARLIGGSAQDSAGASKIAAYLRGDTQALGSASDAAVPAGSIFAKYLKE